MAYEFQKLADVEAVEEFPEEGASVLIEHEGDIKKCPADGIGGGGGSGIPLLRTIVDPETGDTNLELDDGRTADEFVESFEKDGVCLMLYSCVEVTEDYTSGSCFYQFSLDSVQKMSDNPPPAYAPAAGGVMYIYEGPNALYLTNVDMENVVLMDHYEFVMNY